MKWFIKESDHYIFHVHYGSLAQKDLDEIIDYQEHCLRYMLKVLKLNLDDKIQYFLCESLDEVGMYYGDYIAMNCGKYYNRFSLNEEKNILTYAINTSSKTMDKGEVITMHKFSANEYGMIIDLSTKTLFVDYPENVVTTIKCDYETQINKKIYL